MSKKNKIILISAVSVVIIAAILCAIFIPISLKNRPGDGVNKFGFEVANSDKTDYIYATGDDPNEVENAVVTTENVNITPITSNIQNLMNLVDNKKGTTQNLRLGNLEAYYITMNYGNSSFSLTIYPPEISGNKYNFFFEYVRDTTVASSSSEYYSERYEFNETEQADVVAIMTYLDTLNS